MDIFKKNDYTENFINNCFKRLIANMVFKKKMIIVPRKTFVLVLPCLGPSSLQTRTKLRKFSQKYSQLLENTECV